MSGLFSLAMKALFLNFFWDLLFNARLGDFDWAKPWHKWCSSIHYEVARVNRKKTFKNKRFFLFLRNTDSSVGFTDLVRQRTMNDKRHLILSTSCSLLFGDSFWKSE